jgi:CRISPR-associated protein Csx10
MTYHTQEIQIELRSPLVLGSDRENPIFIETREYIPGGALRGAVARLIKEVESVELLETLFGPEVTPPIFENLYASRGGAFTYPIPLSARTCKYNSGFLSQGMKHHGIGDILIWQAAFENTLLDSKAKLPYLYQPRCPKCQEEVARPAIEFYETIGGVYHPVRVPVRRLARTAINRHRYTAADQLLYTLETIEPGTLHGDDQKRLLFRGAVRYQPEHAELLQTWLPKVNWIGGGRSRGLGQISVELVDDDTTTPILSKRLAALNEAVWEEYHFYQRVAGATPPPTDTVFFSLDLLSATIFTRFGLPATEPDFSEIGLSSANAQIYRAFTDQKVVGGWHMSAGLPRRTMLTTVAGSVYLIGVQGLSLQELATLLEPIETSGLGAERERGFGRILISSPFHYQAEVTL